jgi:hypothetical protein
MSTGTNDGTNGTADAALDALLERLRVVAATVDPPPALVVESGRAAFAMRAIDAELAELVRDSAVDRSPVLVRDADSDSAVRLLSFEAGEVSIEVQVTDTEGTRTLLGVVDGATGSVEVETMNGRSTASIDAHGRFTVHEVPPGTVRLHVQAPDGTTVTTSWVTL